MDNYKTTQSLAQHICKAACYVGSTIFTILSIPIFVSTIIPLSPLFAIIVANNYLSGSNLTDNIPGFESIATTVLGEPNPDEICDFDY